MKKITVVPTLVTTLALTGALAVVGAGTASAKGGGGAETRGRCTSTATWKLKVKPDNGRLEVEFEVDSNRVGQTWAVRIRDNGLTVFAANRVTRAPSGSFVASKLTPNRAGRDSFLATATNLRTRETCTGRLTY